MTTKLSEVKGFDCWAKALPDEPYFTLLARDPSAPLLVRSWARQRDFLILKNSRPRSDYTITGEARVCADNMEKWRDQNKYRWREEKAPTTEELADKICDILRRQQTDRGELYDAVLRELKAFGLSTEEK